MPSYIEITIAAVDAARRDWLVMSLEAAGFEGFEEEESCLKAYIPEGRLHEAALTEFLREQGLAADRRILPEQNWNQVWESSFDPVVIGEFCAIRASFHAPVPGVSQEIVITPKMSFGTGHHATTWLMVTGMRGLDFTHRQVLDFGTGTGILAILADRLGAASVTALDNDPWSIDNALENTQRNHAASVTVIQADDLSGVVKADVILANINRPVLLKHLPRIADLLTEEGTFLLSGILSDDSETLQKAARAQGLRLLNQEERAGWVSQLWKKDGGSSVQLDKLV